MPAPAVCRTCGAEGAGTVCGVCHHAAVDALGRAHNSQGVRYRRLAGAGLCAVCGQRPAVPGRRRCAQHATSARQRQRRRYFILRIAYRCVDCTARVERWQPRCDDCRGATRAANREAVRRCRARARAARKAAAKRPPRSREPAPDAALLTRFAVHLPGRPHVERRAD